jgi:hypothetical protein
MVRECNLRIPVNISGKTGLSAALWANCFTARSVFLKMESVLTHNAFVFDYCKSERPFVQSAVLAALQENIVFRAPNCKTEETASCNAGSFIAVLG